MKLSPTTPENQKVLDASKEWFKNKIIVRHIANTKKLVDIKEFDINPFLTPYLSFFLTGEVSTIGLAKALVYARTLGTSISTSFGANVQNFISDVLVSAYGSVVQGVDIVFTDKVDNRKKYAQLKLGPNTINKDDVETIDRHFKTIKNLARTNQANITNSDLIVGVLYGSNESLSAHYKKLRDDYFYSVFVGEEFWYRLTGDKDFMMKLISSITESIKELDSSTVLDEVISQLAQSEEIKRIVQLSNSND
jgi:hypothetical protein